jgi:hypothetical protein
MKGRGGCRWAGRLQQPPQRGAVRPSGRVTVTGVGQEVMGCCLAGESCDSSVDCCGGRQGMGQGSSCTVLGELRSPGLGPGLGSDLSPRSTPAIMAVTDRFLAPRHR